MKTYVIGHLKPDTDAVVAAMALAELYRSKECYAYADSNPEAVITEAINPETAYLLEKFGVATPRIITATELSTEDRVILVDHNEADQRLSGLNQDQIVEIVDHHKVNLNLKNPIFLTFKTWGSSNTIVAFMMQKNNFTPKRSLAGLMLAAILSDTVGFKSATCTPKDKEMAAWLAELAEIRDLEAFSLEIFKAKSDISSLSDEDIVKNDYKIFDFAGKKVLIDQLETVEQAEILANKKAGLLTAMAKVKAELQLDYIFVAITDVLQVNTKVLLLDEAAAAVATKAFGGVAVDQILDIGERMSRKKEIAPPIETALS